MKLKAVVSLTLNFSCIFIYVLSILEYFFLLLWLTHLLLEKIIKTTFSWKVFVLS